MAEWSNQDTRKFLSRTQRDRDYIKKLLGKKKDVDDADLRRLRKKDTYRRKEDV